MCIFKKKKKEPVIEEEMLWVDKYRPKTLDKVLLHQDIAQNLKKLVIVAISEIIHFCYVLGIRFSIFGCCFLC